MAEPRRAPLLRVGAATTLVVLAFSVINPVLAVELQRRGVGTAAIGVFAMLPFLAVAALVPLMPRVFARLGVVRAYRWGLVLETLGTAGYTFTDAYLAWCACALLGAIGAAAAWNGTEALIAFNAPPERRGRFTGLYQSALGAALALGPFVPALVNGVLPHRLDAGPDLLIWTGAALFLAAIAITSGPGVASLSASHGEAPRGGLWQAGKSRPALVWLAVAGGVFEAGLGGISAAYGSQLGLSLAAATSLAGVLGVGSFLLQYPAGWLADHAPLPRVFAVAGVVLLLSAAAFAATVRWPPLFWVATFLWGAVGGALYTLVMIRVAHDFAGTSTVGGTAAMITGYTVGGAAGPLVSGVVLDAFGAPGQAAWLAVLALSVIAAARASRGSPG